MLDWKRRGTMRDRMEPTVDDVRAYLAPEAVWCKFTGIYLLQTVGWVLGPGTRLQAAQAAARRRAAEWSPATPMTPRSLGSGH